MPQLAPAQRSGDQPPVLTAFAINAGTEIVDASEPYVSLAHTAVGARPSDYRVSHRADFVGAQWLPYQETPTLQDWFKPSGDACDAGPASRRITLFFQVRATTGTEVRIIDGQRVLVPTRVESNVLRDSICARTADDF